MSERDLARLAEEDPEAAGTMLLRAQGFDRNGRHKDEPRCREVRAVSCPFGGYSRGKKARSA
jgi:hypothetical protein